MLTTLLDALRSVLGSVTGWYHQMGSGSGYQWDYGLMFEYFVAATLLIVTVVSVFKILINFSKK